MSATHCTCSDLRAQGRDIRLPFTLRLDDGETLVFTALLRLLPEKRLSGIAEWRGKTVFAKLFISGQAGKHAQRELDGCRALAKAGIPTPAVLANQPFGERGFAVLSEYLPGVEPLAPQSSPSLFELAFRLAGQLHDAGLIHGDLHLGNFLHRDGQLFLVDGDAVKAGNTLDNLALLLAQFPAGLPLDIAPLLVAYGRPVDRLELEKRVYALRAQRLRHFLGKTQRDCTEFAVEQDGRRFVAVRREHARELAPLVANPDAAVARGKALKDGRTCTVTHVHTPAGEAVIKRYNIKNWRHAISRAWRPSRAWHSWREAHRLLFLGVATPQPLALIEARAGPLRGKAYYISAFVSGPSLLEVLSPQQAPAPSLQQALLHLFQTLEKQRISHGDLKATNLLWVDGKIVLIDLDAMQHHRSHTAHRRAWRRDRARLLRNWPSECPLVHWLDAHLPEA